MGTSMKGGERGKISKPEVQLSKSSTSWGGGASSLVGKEWGPQEKHRGILGGGVPGRGFTKKKKRKERKTGKNFVIDYS